MSKLEIVPISYRAACEYINANHRHHIAPRGCKWAVAAKKDGELVGVATCGRPVARMLDDGRTCEVTRLCTDGTHNACSALYGACARVAREMGYLKIVTYILDEEPGTSLRASGWTLAGNVRGQSWDRQNRAREDKHPTCDKQRWERYL